MMSARGSERVARGPRRFALGAAVLALALVLVAAAPALAMDAPQTRWSRLWGQGALDTMQRVVGCGDASEYGNAFADGRGGTVVVATMGGYWDALTASGLAGIEDAPLLMTDASSLSSQTASELERLSPDRVVICGGDMAVSEGVEGEISDLTGAEVVRLAGTDAQDTARRVHGASDQWSKTAFVATVASFQDALSVAPYAYAEHCPIFLTGWDGRLSEDTLSDIEAGGFDSVYVVGGSMVVSPDVEGQLGGLFAGRLWGADAADTSARSRSGSSATGCPPTASAWRRSPATTTPCAARRCAAGTARCSCSSRAPTSRASTGWWPPTPTT